MANKFLIWLKMTSKFNVLPEFAHILPDKNIVGHFLVIFEQRVFRINTLKMTVDSLHGVHELFKLEFVSIL